MKITGFIRCIFWLELSIVSPEYSVICFNPFDGQGVARPRCFVWNRVPHPGDLERLVG